MARTPQNYAHNTQLATSAVDVVPTVASNTSAVVRKLSFYNSSTTTNRTVTVYVVESGGTADTGTTLAVKAIPPLKTWNVIEIQAEIIETGMKVQADQDVGTDVNVNCSGADIT
ncbi:MAG: hypothetical protein V3U84_11520 [Thiotrichaceae bacterium]